MNKEAMKQIDDFFDEDGWDEGYSSNNVWSREEYNDLDFMCDKISLWTKLEREYLPSMIKDSDWYYVPFDMFDCASEKVRQSDRFLLELLKAYDLEPSAVQDGIENSVYSHVMTKVICFLNLLDKPQINEKLQSPEFLKKAAQEEKICSILNEINHMDIRTHAKIYAEMNSWSLWQPLLYKNPKEYPHMVSDLCGKLDEYRNELSLPVPERIEGLPDFDKIPIPDMVNSNEQDDFLEEKQTWSREQCNDVDFMCSKMSYWAELEEKFSSSDWVWHDMPIEIFSLAGEDVKSSDAFLLESLRAFVIDSPENINMKVPRETSIGRHLKIMGFLKLMDKPEVQKRLYSPEFLVKMSQEDRIYDILHEINRMDSANSIVLPEQLLWEVREIYKFDDPDEEINISLADMPESANYVSALCNRLEEYRSEPLEIQRKRTGMNDFESFMYKALKDCDVVNSSNINDREKIYKTQVQFQNLLSILNKKSGKDFRWYLDERISEHGWKIPFNPEKKKSQHKPYFLRKKEKKR